MGPFIFTALFLLWHQHMSQKFQGKITCEFLITERGRMSAYRILGGHCVGIVHKLSSHFFWFESKLSTADDPDAFTKGEYLKRTNMIQLALMCKSWNGRVIFPTRNKWVMNRKEKKTVVIGALALPKQPATARDSGVFSPTLVDADEDPLRGHCELILIIPAGLILGGQDCLTITLSQKKTHFSGQGFPDTVPLNCETFLTMGTEEKKRAQILPHPPHTPHRHTLESKGPQPHPRNPAQYPGISYSPFLKSPSSLPPGLIQTELIWPEPLLKSHHTSETIKYTKL